MDFWSKTGALKRSVGDSSERLPTVSHDNKNSLSMCLLLRNSNNQSVKSEKIMFIIYKLEKSNDLCVVCENALCHSSFHPANLKWHLKRNSRQKSVEYFTRKMIN